MKYLCIILIFLGCSKAQEPQYKTDYQDSAYHFKIGDFNSINNGHTTIGNYLRKKVVYFYRVNDSLEYMATFYKEEFDSVKAGLKDYALPIFELYTKKPID